MDLLISLGNERLDTLIHLAILLFNYSNPLSISLSRVFNTHDMIYTYSGFHNNFYWVIYLFEKPSLMCQIYASYAPHYVISHGGWRESSAYVIMK